MSLKEKAKATAENLEGKARETAGEIAGDPQEQAEGKAKQIDAQTRHAAEHLKEEIDRKLD